MFKNFFPIIALMSLTLITSDSAIGGSDSQEECTAFQAFHQARYKLWFNYTGCDGSPIRKEVKPGLNEFVGKESVLTKEATSIVPEIQAGQLPRIDLKKDQPPFGINCGGDTILGTSVALCRKE